MAEKKSEKLRLSESCEHVPFISVLLNDEINFSDMENQMNEKLNNEKTMKHNYEILIQNKSLDLVLKELQVITNKIRHEEEEEKNNDDCRFAAMVIDRLCLVFFSTATLLSTVLTIFTAKNFFRLR